MTDLAQHIQQTPLIDTHEHLESETKYVNDGPDVLQDLFGNYVSADLVVAGASEQAVERLLDSSDPDLRGRFAEVREAWQQCLHTGYGEVVRMIAQRVYGMDEITPEGLEAARERNLAQRQPGERRRILRDIGNLDHVQIDNFVWSCLPDPGGMEFFLYDLSWRDFCVGGPDLDALHEETGVEVVDLGSLNEGMAALFAKYGPYAIAVKSQHAYNRTLIWQERNAGEVERVLQKYLKGNDLNEVEALCLGDWCWARGVKLAVEYNLPFKIHTGYYAGHSRMPIKRIRPAHLCDLLLKYPDARFVLMHIAYPYNDELAAIAKHFPNVYVDMCWSWSIDPYSAADFVRTMIHTVPINKLFAFGGDTQWPNAAVAYASQARQWLNRALQAEIDDGLLTEKQAIDIATRIMYANQEACFDIESTRAALRAVAER